MQTQSLEIREEYVSDKFEEIKSLTEEHWQEITLNKELMKLKPVYKAYELMDQYKSALSLFAYVDEKLVGYSINFVHPHLHYADLMTCHNDLLFLSPAYRNSPIGLKLIRETVKKAKERGAKVMSWHAKKGSTLDKLLERMDYKVQDIVYYKPL